MKTTIKANNLEFSFVDEDVIALDEIYYAGESNPHNDRMFLLHDHGFTICVVMAQSLQDALDIAADHDKMDRYLINVEDEYERSDYMTDDPSKIVCGFDVNCPEYKDKDGKNYWWKVEPTFLGDAGEPFDIETLGYVEFPLPKRSLVRLYGESVGATSYHV